MRKKKKEERRLSWYSHLWSGMFKPTKPSFLGKQADRCIWTTTLSVSEYDNGTPLREPIHFVVEVDLTKDRIDIYRPEAGSVQIKGGKVE